VVADCRHSAYYDIGIEMEAPGEREAGRHREATSRIHGDELQTAMNCTICGMHTSHGALLCRPCKAALKRARQLTVQEVPRLGVRAAADRARRGAPVQPSSRTDERERSVNEYVGRMLLGAAAFAALAGAVYIVERELVGRTAIALPTPAVVVRATDPAPAEVAVASDAVIAATPARGTAPEPTPASHRETPTVAPTRMASATPTPATRGSLGNTREARRQENPVAPQSTYPELDSFGPLAEAPKPSPPPAVLPRAPPPPDRWQVMSEALSRCANEGGLSGFICDQRVRLASCGGYWGRVAQCPYPPENPR
jgi:hypothetical protein